MNKKIIALAVAAAFSAPAFADVTVYGRAHLSLDSNSGNAAATTTAGTKNGLNLTSNASRLGFKGTEDLANGLKAVYQLETEVSGTGAASSTNSTGLFVTQRDTYIGVTSEFGTVLAGRLPLANQYVGDANFFGDKVGDAGNLTAGGLGGIGLICGSEPRQPRDRLRISQFGRCVGARRICAEHHSIAHRYTEQPGERFQLHFACIV